MSTDSPGLLSRLGDAEQKDLKVERTLVLKEEGEVAELRYKQEEEAWDRHFLLCCIKRCFFMDSPLYSQQHFPPVHHGLPLPQQ